jgi:hypothetical protein
VTLGRSEITKPIRYYTDAAARTLLGLEVNREFYNAPQRIGLNVDEDVRGRVRRAGEPVDVDHGPQSGTSLRTTTASRRPT